MRTLRIRWAMALFAVLRLSVIVGLSPLVIPLILSVVPIRLLCRRIPAMTLVSLTTIRLIIRRVTSLIPLLVLLRLISLAVFSRFVR